MVFWRRRRRDEGQEAAGWWKKNDISTLVKAIGFPPKVFIAAECDPIHVKPLEKIPSSH